MNPDDLTGLIVCLMALAFLLWLLPSCGNPRCTEAHSIHTAHERELQKRADAESTHRTWHRGSALPDMHQRTAARSPLWHRHPRPRYTHPRAASRHIGRPACEEASMTADELLAWMARDVPLLCVCGRLIPDGAAAYGFPLSLESDEPMAFVSEWHDPCLREWGWVRSDDEWGIAHAPGVCVEGQS